MPIHPFVQRARREFLNKAKPIWYDAVVEKYPPIQFTAKAYKPRKIEYPEDQIRSKFYAEHPLELQKPIDLQEGTSFSLSPESCVAWTRENMESGMSLDEAYKLASERYYSEKKRREVEKRIQVDQASQLGAISPIFLQEEFLNQELEATKESSEKMNQKKL